jgi:uncharacterized protein YxeA
MQKILTIVIVLLLAAALSFATEKKPVKRAENYLAVQRCVAVIDKVPGSVHNKSID